VEKRARGLSPWFQKVGLTAEDAKELAVACAEEGVSCPLSLCMMPEEDLCRRLQARLAPGQRPYVRYIVLASRECVASQRGAPLTPANAPVPEWLASVGFDEDTVAEALRALEAQHVSTKGLVMMLEEAELQLIANEMPPPLKHAFLSVVLDARRSLQFKLGPPERMVQERWTLSLKSFLVNLGTLDGANISRV